MQFFNRSNFVTQSLLFVTVDDYHFNHVLQDDAEDQTASDLAVVLFEMATLRSGYQLADTKAYGDRIERMLRLSMNVGLDEQASLCQLLHTVSVKKHLHRKFQFQPSVNTFSSVLIKLV